MYEKLKAVNLFLIPNMDRCKKISTRGVDASVVVVFFFHPSCPPSLVLIYKSLSL